MRKAKEAARQKIDNWCGGVGTQRNAMSAKNKNAINTSDDRTPLKTQSKNTNESVKRCSVRIERLTVEKTVNTVSPKKVVTTNATKKVGEKRAMASDKNVFDYTFDGDADAISLEQDNQNELQDLFKKMAKENKIVVKKYRPKIAKKQAESKTDEKKVVAKKRRNEKKSVAEPPRKKPNLKVDQIVYNGKRLAAQNPKVSKSKQTVVAENVANNNFSLDDIENLSAITDSIADKELNAHNDRSKPTERVNTRLQLRNNPTSQSTPKVKAPVVAKPTATVTTSSLAVTKPNTRRNVLEDFSKLKTSSPLTNSNRANKAHSVLGQQRLRLPTINDASETNFELSDNEIDFGGDDFFDNAFEPELDIEVADKENSLDRPQKASTSAQSTAGSNDKSNFIVLDDSSYNIFSPTKRVGRVYGRSPLKNITHEVINTNNDSSFESMRTNTKPLQSFGANTISPLKSISDFRAKNVSKEADITLPEVEHLTSNRIRIDNDPFDGQEQFLENCFGFDFDGDDDELNLSETVDNNQSKLQESVAGQHTIIDKNALKQTRLNLKRFLTNADGKDESSAKKAKRPERKANKKAKSPAKPTQAPPIFNVESDSRQQDIRSAFTAKPVAAPKRKKKEAVEPETDLFGVIKQDRRISYSRPARRNRKRRISIDSDVDDDDDSDSENEGEDANQKKTKTKRRKKLDESDPKDIEELEKFAQDFNSMCEEVDQYELITEN